MNAQTRQVTNDRPTWQTTFVGVIEPRISCCPSPSSVKAYEVVRAERPDLAAALRTKFPFSRNGEQREDEPAWFSWRRWSASRKDAFPAYGNRNRLENALKIEGVPQSLRCSARPSSFSILWCAALN